MNRILDCLKHISESRFVDSFPVLDFANFGDIRPLALGASDMSRSVPITIDAYTILSFTAENSLMLYV